jgi:glycosyltransferase involved in cell wall biosynthesis
MTLRLANELERSGRLVDALKVNRQISANSDSSSPIAKLAQGNILRILSKLKGDERSQAESNVKGAAEVQKRGIAAPKIPAQKNAADLSTPLVSIVVPCYNCQEYLAATIRSLQSQTYSRFEVILIDDMSVDNSAAIAKEASSKDKRFRFYQHRANGGLSAARNSGIRLSKGEFVCFLDSDDLLASTSIEQRVKALIRVRNYSFVAGVFDQSTNVPDKFDGIVEAKPVKVAKEYVDFVSTSGDCPFNANQPMLKRTVLVELGGFPENYPQAEDWRFWSKALRAGYIFLPVESVGSGYRQTANSMVRRAPLLHVQKSFGNFFRAHRAYSEETDPIEIAYEERYRAAPLYSQPVGMYEARRRFLSRLLNFLGIEFARCKDKASALSVATAVDRVQEIEPEFSLVFAGYTAANAIGWFEAGYKRYFGVDSITQQAHEVVVGFVDELIDRLGAGDKSLLIDHSKRLIPNRKLIKNSYEYIDVIFFPHKEYHTRSFELLLPGLAAAGLSFVFVDISIPYRNENARTKSLDKFTLSYNEFVLSKYIPRSIVCMNDWDTVVRPVVKAANKIGIPTIGIVEGVQDYSDVDTGRARNAYREVANVFLPGSFDRRYFVGTSQNLFDIGIQRLEGLEHWTNIRKLKEVKSPPLIVLNVNFSYGVLVDKRASWVADVAEACRRTGYQLVVSQHPQDQGDLSGHKVSAQPLYELLCEADFFISRFSGAILESLVIGCPVIYFNGHNELIDKFSVSSGAYDIANSLEDLIKVLERGPCLGNTSDKFLKEHGGIDRNQEVTVVGRTVDAIERIVRGSPSDLVHGLEFKKLLGA